MLALLKKIHIQIFLDENMCNQCEIDWNMQGFQEWVHVWNEQFRHESHSVEVIDKIYSIEQQEKKTSRRDFLRIVPKKTTKQVASFMFDSFEKTTIRKKIPHSPKRDILKAFIEKYGEQNIHAKISEQIHVYDICTDEYCSLCGKCSVLCPTGALYEQMGSTEKTLFFDPIKCIGCSVCTRYCKHLYMKKANVIRLECCKTKMLTSKNQSACPRCGELKNADEPFCGDCHIQEKRKTLTLG
ncbi:ATP-binding protein [Anoxybacillus sp. TBDG-1]